MSVLEDIQHAVWDSRSPRTLATGTASTNSDYLTQIAGAVWTYRNRTLTRPRHGAQVTIPADTSSVSIDVASPVNWSSPLNRGLSMWLLNLPGQGGAKVRDLCKKNDGTLTNGPTFSSTVPPGGFTSVLLDGTDDYVLSNDARGFASDLMGAVAIWARPTSLASDRAAWSLGRTANSDFYNVRVNGGGTNWAVGLRSGVSDTVLATSPSGSAVVNVWHRLVLVMTSAGTRFFINGRESTLTYSTGTSSTQTWFGNAGTAVNKAAMGVRLTATPGQFHIGNLADMSIWGPNSWAVGDPAGFAVADYKSSVQSHPDRLRRSRRPFVIVPGPAVLPETARSQSPAIDAASPINWSHPLNRGLVGWWLATSGSGGAKLRDLTKKNDGVLQAGVTWKATANGFMGVVGDGIDTHGVEANTFPSGFNSNSDLTFAVTFGGTSSSNEVVVLSNASYTGLTIRGNGSARSNNFGTDIVAGPGATTAVRRVVFTQSGTLNSLYINGVLYATSSTARDSTTITRLWILKNTYLGGSEAMPAGTIVSDVSVSNRAWSATEVMQDYQCGKLGYPGRLNRANSYSLAPANTIISPTGGLDVAVNAASPLNRTHPLARGLVGFWLATPDQHGAKWRDIAGRNDGVLTNGPVWRPPSRKGAFGNLYLDGTGYVDIPDSPDQRPAATVTVVAWVRTTMAANSIGRMVTKTSDASTNAYSLSACVSGSTFDGRTTGAAAQGTTAINDGKWHFGAMTVNSAGVLKVYTDGVQEGTNAGATITYSSNRNALIGRFSSSFPQQLTGDIDGAMIYNRALSASEVSQLYKESSLGYPELLNRKGWLGCTPMPFRQSWARRSNVVIVVGGI